MPAKAHKIIPHTDAARWLMESPPAAETTLNGHRYLYFAGTGYLGLQAHPEVIAAAQSATERYGIHTATSRTGYGTAPPHAEVERRAADFFGVEAGLYLATGYAVNFAIAATISPMVDLVLIDELAHDCLREATRWLENLKMPPIKFRHRDTGHIAEILREHCRPDWRPLLMTDGIFSVNGSLSPLSEYLEALCNYDESLMLVDDAHGVGAIGDSGKGSLEIVGVMPCEINADLARPVSTGVRVFRSATMSKAVGGYGGMLAGDLAFLERASHSSGWFRGASAPAAAVAAATAKALEIVQTQPELRRRLAKNVEQARAGLQKLGVKIEMSPSPIISLSIGQAEQKRRVQKRLQDEGIMIAYFQQYTGSGSQGTLRIAIFATHTPEMIDRLVATLHKALQEEMLI